MDSALHIDHLTKSYGGTPAVDGLSLDVKRGEIFGLIGPNGAGKTTTVECAVGLRAPDVGTIRMLGLDPQAQGRRLRQRIGVQLQDAALPARLTVREAAALFAALYDNPADPERLLATWGLADQRDTAFADLSGGQQQRLFITLALINTPDLVVLDEISTGLDPEARRATRDLIRSIRERGTSVVLVTHFMDEAEALCDRVAMLVDGRLIALDTPARLIETHAPAARVQFTAPPDFEAGTLDALEAVTRIERSNGRITAYGRGPLLARVAQHLDAHGVTPPDLTHRPPTLDDVFSALAGSGPDDAA
ncbi:MAG: ATP-binding cassette domain-containing protein [Bacteroidetes bacterium]|jgi:ABC-2 type transport system ATP-binding protein|nr:ATP-binding cassette domain-containing protein [Bacteroidota bacterium]